MAAAVLNLPLARVAGASAAYLHGLRGWRQGRPVVMVPYGGNARSKKSRIIRSAQYDEVAFVRTRGFEVTSVAETLLTLAAETSGSRLVETLDDSLLTGKATIGEFEKVFTRVLGARARGAGRLRKLIEERHPDCYGVESTFLERMLERVLADPRIPGSIREHTMSIRGGDGRVDALIEDWGLVVDADSRRWHTRVGDFEADRQRDNDLIARGFRVVRFTYQMLKEDSQGCVRTIIQAGTHE
jgi:very-short-patch-repair endonuclease